MIERIRNSIERDRLIGRGEKAVAAFSGGADSTALLIALSELGKTMGFSVIAAHYNHGIRDEADRDELFCRKTAEELGIPFVSEKGDVPAFAKKKGLSIETAARLLRYDFLYRTVKSSGASCAATAHHADDNAESILLHLVRGSGMAGLTGIKKQTTVDLSYAEGYFSSDKDDCSGTEGKKLTLVRPLLDITKAEIIAFLNERGQDFCEDETNYSADTARNFIRLRVLPELRENINNAAVRNIDRVGEILLEDEEYLTSVAAEALEKAREGEGYSTERLLSLPAPIRKRCLRLALQEKATLVDIERTHLDALEMLLSMQSGSAIDSPHARARISFSKLIIEKSFGIGAENELEKAEIRLPLSEGEYETPLGRFKISLFSDLAMEKNGEEEYNNNMYTHCPKELNVGLMDLDRLTGPLLVRTRRAGDRFRPVNSAFRMKLKDFFISRKVDEQLRGGLPLVLSGGEIVFIPGFLVSDGVKLTDQTKHIIRIEFLGSSGKTV